MINYSKEAKISGLKYSILEFFNKHKLIIIIFAVIIVIALLTGIFTGIKLFAYKKDLDIKDFSFESLTNGSIYSFKVFLQRYLSIIFLLFLMVILSITFFTSIFSYILIAYRSFLLSLNCTLLIVFTGLSGLINGIIIIFPCQILNIIILVFTVVIFRGIFKEKKKCGYIDKTKLKSIWYILLLSFIINIIEVILLLLFKATTILII